MNERIKELAEQADEYAHKATGSPENRTNGKSYNQNYEEKFAELIVRECMEEVMTYQHHRISTREMVPFMVEDIKLHFGVE
jgi:abortive infection bacteriophage resistance protein